MYRLDYNVNGVEGTVHLTNKEHARMEAGDCPIDCYGVACRSCKAKVIANELGVTDTPSDVDCTLALWLITGTDNYQAAAKAFKKVV